MTQKESTRRGLIHWRLLQLVGLIAVFMAIASNRSGGGQIVAFYGGIVLIFWAGWQHHQAKRAG